MGEEGEGEGRKSVEHRLVPCRFHVRPRALHAVFVLGHEDDHKGKRGGMQRVHVDPFAHVTELGQHVAVVREDKICRRSRRLVSV